MLSEQLLILLEISRFSSCSNWLWKAQTTRANSWLCTGNRHKSRVFLYDISRDGSLCWSWRLYFDICRITKGFASINRDGAMMPLLTSIDSSRFATGFKQTNKQTNQVGAMDMSLHSPNDPDLWSAWCCYGADMRKRPKQIGHVLSRNVTHLSVNYICLSVFSQVRWEKEDDLCSSWLPWLPDDSWLLKFPSMDSALWQRRSKSRVLWYPKRAKDLKCGSLPPSIKPIKPRLSLPGHTT